MKPHTLHRLKQEFSYFKPTIPPGKAHCKVVRIMIAFLQVMDAKSRRINREIRRGRKFGFQLEREQWRHQKSLVQS